MARTATTATTAAAQPPISVHFSVRFMRRVSSGLTISSPMAACPGRLDWQRVPPGRHSVERPVGPTVLCAPQNMPPAESLCRHQGERVDCLAQAQNPDEDEPSAYRDKAPAMSPLRKCFWRGDHNRPPIPDTPMCRARLGEAAQAQYALGCANHLLRLRRAQAWLSETP